MNAFKRYLECQGIHTSTPDNGWEMISGKHPMQNGAIWAENHRVDSERAIVFRYVNVMGWEARIFNRDGSYITTFEDFDDFPGFYPEDHSCTEWIRNRINIPRQFTEPFCWHDGCYCNVAYSDHCLKCREAINAYHQFSE